MRKPDALLDYIDSKVVDDGKPYYIVLDEVQLVEEFVEVILSLTHMRNVDVYVSGSNSRFLSSDVVTEFRGRGDEIRIWPLTFDEYFNGIGGDIRKAWLDYYTFGGLPQVALLETEEKKTDYLRGLYETTYLRDVIERNHLRNPEGMKELVRVIASGIGSSTNPTRIANTFQSVQGVTIKRDTIKQYIDYLKDSFLIEEALRYDVKGRKYIGTETKYYFADIGIRAAILNYRQQEETHIMENIIYNELRSRGYNVDVGLVELGGKDENGKFVRKQLEVDFVDPHGLSRTGEEGIHPHPRPRLVYDRRLCLLPHGEQYCFRPASCRGLCYWRRRGAGYCSVVHGVAEEDACWGQGVMQPIVHRVALRC